MDICRIVVGLEFAVRFRSGAVKHKKGSIPNGLEHTRL
jgi:hypothetical protein